MKKSFKKILITVSLSLIAVLYSNKSYCQMGEAIEFHYDNAGNRIARVYNPWTALNKYGDTLTHTTPPDTITNRDNRFLKDDVIVRAYPNPTTNFLIIENLSWKLDDRAEVHLYDISGKLITIDTITQAKENFPLGDIAAGSYHVHYYLNGKLLTSWKIVRQ